MADQKISELTAITGANTADDDVLVIVDTSASETKKITLGELENALAERDFNFGDNDKLTFGAGSDLQIYHSGTSSDIDEVGTGNLRIGAENFVVQNADHTENMISAAPNGQVVLYHDNSIKFNTSSTGINVTGTVTADGLTVDGNFQLNGDITVTDTSGDPFLKLETGEQSYVLRIDNDASDIFHVRDVTNSANRIGVASNGDISFYDDQGSSQSFFWDASAERLSLGTTSASTELHVKGSGDYAALTLEATTSGGASYVNLGDSADIDVGQLAYFNSDNSMRFTTNATERMRIDSSGNVGIGTSSLGYTGFADNLTIADSSNGGLTIRTGASAQGAIYFSDTTGDVAGQYAGFLVYNQSGNHMAFGTSSTERMRIDSSGNVGIGTSSPAVLSHVAAGYTAPTGGLDAGIRSLVSSTGYTGLGILSASNASAYIHFGDPDDSDVGGIIYNHSSNYMQFNTNATERMRIDSSGNVGIGLTPSSGNGVLQIAGGLRIAGSASASDTTAPYIFRTSGVNNMVLATEGTERMRIDSSGRVGIGTSSPDTPLHIETSANTGIKLKSSTTGTGYINFSDAAVAKGQLLYDHNGDYMRFYVNNSERMRIDSSGNLLVGKTSTAIGTAGTTLWGDGLTDHTRSGEVLRVNRLSTDGDIATFRKDGTTVGSIGSHSSNITIGTGATGLRFYDTENVIMPRNPSTGANVDGTVSLGEQLNRFKDLYLSGGVYLGGVGAANKLDDYEEGTFTPSYGGAGADPTATYMSQTSGHYTKIGDLVHCQVEVRTSAISGGSGDLKIEGFPFTSSSLSELSQGAVTLYNVDFNTNYIYTFEMNSSANHGFIRASRNGATSENIQVGDVNNVSPSLIRFTVSYKVA